MNQEEFLDFKFILENLTKGQFISFLKGNIALPKETRMLILDYSFETYKLLLELIKTKNLTEADIEDICSSKANSRIAGIDRLMSAIENQATSSAQSKQAKEDKKIEVPQTQEIMPDSEEKIKYRDNLISILNRYLKRYDFLKNYSIKPLWQYKSEIFDFAIVEPQESSVGLWQCNTDVLNCQAVETFYRKCSNLPYKSIKMTIATKKCIKSDVQKIALKLGVPLARTDFHSRATKKLYGSEKELEEELLKEISSDHDVGLIFLLPVDCKFRIFTDWLNYFDTVYRKE